MADKKQLIAELYAGLQSLSSSAFPKRCRRCGREFRSVEDFLLQTEGLENSTGLKATADDQEQTLVELFRNCPCGSTLMEIFSDRRDMSPAGIERRENFGRLMTMLIADGMAAATARGELLKVLHGGDSPILRARGIDIRTH
ncbi:hypothetical protein JCM30471_17260 [Desulfuromonas carbonis]|uniref:hypothetical protein n=1 Tax=Desulfuromonas sp. DDH964 TaxID=1823759 RepID=UPI00078BEBE3|nr:hypothetical protein [Desulfuromonas sp. DDH964]AMV73324.1 hypothetical protein DBW_3016 [Desulfuromonas sp. DDH964]